MAARRNLTVPETCFSENDRSFSRPEEKDRDRRGKQEPTQNLEAPATNESTDSHQQLPPGGAHDPEAKRRFPIFLLPVSLVSVQQPVLREAGRRPNARQSSQGDLA